MKIRFYHVRILTMEEDRPVFEGELHVKDDRISDFLCGRQPWGGRTVCVRIV